MNLIKRPKKVITAARAYILNPYKDKMARKNLKFNNKEVHEMKCENHNIKGFTDIEIKNQFHKYDQAFHDMQEEIKRLREKLNNIESSTAEREYDDTIY